MTYSWLVYNLFTTCSLLVHHLFITCSSLVHHLFITCSSLVHDLFMTCSGLVHDLFTTCSGLFHDLIMTCIVVLAKARTCLQLVNDLQGCTFSIFMTIFSPMSFSEIFELFPKFMRKLRHFWIHLKFHQNQNQVSNSWDIADIKFLWWWGVVVVVKSFSCKTQPLSWG